MKIYSEIYDYLSKALDVDVNHITLILNTILIILIIYFIKKVGAYFIYLVKDERKEFIYNQRLKITLNIIQVILLIFVWDEYIKDFITLVSFISAAIAFALRDIILNWFCGVYIRIKKVFKVEDRIEIDGIKGDVLMISTLGFELLEVSEKEENGQSTGVIVNFPNSVIFTKAIRNITKGFKYVWNEMYINIPLDANLTEAKTEIYRIINNIDEIKNTPKKMQNAIRNINAEYHIYYNQYNPVIYTKIVDKHIELTVRYLINPKKARFVESRIWNQIYASYQNGVIDLYKE